jgi:AraC-like DNA-binding protein/ligand-binding sensor protein
MELITFAELARFPVFQRFYRLAWRLFGVSLALVRPDGRDSVLLGAYRKMNPFCRLLKADPAGRRLCADCDFMHQEEAKRLKTAQRYACHAGLTDFTIPVFGDGQVIALLQCGQIHDRPPTAEKWEKTRRHLQGLPVDFKKLEKYFFATKVIPVRDQQNLIELMEIFTNYITDTDKRWLLLDRGRKSQIVQLAEQYIQGHLAGEMHLDEIAAAAFTSPRNLSRVFAAETKMTVLAFIHSARVETACQELKSTRKKISEVAFECGFGSIQQFNRVFKKTKKCTPEEFRARK